MADVVKKVVVENVPKIYGSGYTIDIGLFQKIATERHTGHQCTPFKWDFEDNYFNNTLGWNYVKTVSTPTYNTLVPLDPDTNLPAQGVRIWVQQPTSSQVHEPFARIFEGQDPIPS